MQTVPQGQNQFTLDHFIFYNNNVLMKLNLPCCDLIMFFNISEKYIMLNSNRAHETAGIWRLKINYILVVNTISGEAKAKYMLGNKPVKKKSK